MRKRDFVQPTAEEIENRKKMYEEAERLGIDLMSFDGEKKRVKLKRIFQKNRYTSKHNQ